MNPLCYFIVVVFTLTLIPPTAVYAANIQDMREIQVNAREKLTKLQEKAAAEKEAARHEADASRKKIIEDRTSLKREIKRLETEVRKLENSVSALNEKQDKLATEESALIAKLDEANSVVRELVGLARIHAKDLLALINESLQTAINGESTKFLQEIAATSRFPGIDDIRRMNDMAHNQLTSGGAVRLTQGTIVDRTGNSVEADILAIGNFTAAYRLDGEVGFLNHSSSGQKLFALSRLPSDSQGKQLLAYMEGRDDSVPIDISRGAAISQLTRSPNLWEQIQSGGPLVWPILAILAVGILIVFERLHFLLKSRTDADGFTVKIDTLAETGDWQACTAECDSLSGKPLARVIGAGLACINKKRETMENALQEAILREIPPMERFLSTLGVLAAIAPLLGLLGTVTGMINTFHVITQYGTGDPRMMSGGISVALVTTMLGLSVAIPVMLVHTLLNRTVNNRLAILEEKAVALVNIAEKYNDIR